VKVALIQDRPVLGGNGSSEVRVWPEGHTNKSLFPHVGDIVNEILPPIVKGPGQVFNGVSANYYDDAKKLAVVKAQLGGNSVPKDFNRIVEYYMQHYENIIKRLFEENGYKIDYREKSSEEANGPTS
jgi:hypothetical protein